MGEQAAAGLELAPHTSGPHTPGTSHMIVCGVDVHGQSKRGTVELGYPKLNGAVFMSSLVQSLSSTLFATFVAAGLVVLPAHAQEARGDRPEPVSRAIDLVSDNPRAVTDAIDYFIRRKNPDGAFALVQAMRFHRNLRPALGVAASSITGVDHGDSWFKWMEWLQQQDDLVPFDGFDESRALLLAQIDPNFYGFIYPGVAHDIALWEAVWGGVLKDGIPALTNPELVTESEADYLTDDELVFGVEINGDVRAYPLRIMDWHEMFNDVIGGVPVSLAYCTLCGSGILFETVVEGRDTPLTFGSSGLLYRSNKLMYDHQTQSLWNQFTGRPVVGDLTGSGIELKTRPVTITTWGDWRRSNPETRVLSLNTGYNRNYTPGAPYADYFNSPDLIFPAPVDEADLKPKDYVFALRGSGAEKAWRLSAFEGGAVLNDVAGVVPVTLIGNAATRTVRAYRTDGRVFSETDDPSVLADENGNWAVSEGGLSGPDGTVFHRMPGHIAFWFAWDGYLGDEGELATLAEPSN